MVILLAISSIANVTLVIFLYRGFMKYHSMLDEQLIKWRVISKSPEASKIVRKYALARIQELNGAGAYEDAKPPA